MLKKYFSLLLAALLLFCGCSKTQDAGKQYRFAAGGASGTYYTLGNYMAAIWDKYAGCDTEILATTGSVENLGMLVSGDADFGIVQNDILYDALNGKEMFAENNDTQGAKRFAHLLGRRVGETRLCDYYPSFEGERGEERRRLVQNLIADWCRKVGVRLRDQLGCRVSL